MAKRIVRASSITMGVYRLVLSIVYHGGESSMCMEALRTDAHLPVQGG